MQTYQRKPIHKITIKEPYLSYIRKGIKTAEGRINSPMCQRLKVGDYIHFYNHKNSTLCQITFLHSYTSFKEMLETEGLEKMLPKIHSIEQGVKIYENFPGSQKVHQYGALAIGVTVIIHDYAS